MKIVLIFFSMVCVLVFQTNERVFAQTALPLPQFGKSYEANKQKFENIVHSLLFISADDQIHDWTGIRKIDMEERQKYFTKQGWAEYQNYVRDHKMILLAVNSEPPLRCLSNFINGSQKYIQETNQKTMFSADGSFICGSFDAFGGMSKFNIILSISQGDVINPTNIMIDKWAVKITQAPKEVPKTNSKGIPNILKKYEDTERKGTQ